MTRHFALDDGGVACGARAQLATYCYNVVTCRRCRRTDEWTGAAEKFDNQPDEAYERAAARARNNDFADTGGRDWT